MNKSLQLTTIPPQIDKSLPVVYQKVTCLQKETQYL